MKSQRQAYSTVIPRNLMTEPHGWSEGTDFSTDVSDTNKKRNMVSKNNKRGAPTPPPPPCKGGGGSSPAWPKLPTPGLHLGAIHKYQE